MATDTPSRPPAPSVGAKLLGNPVTGRGRSGTPRTGRYAVIISVEYLACMFLVVGSAGLVPGESTGETAAAPAVALARMTALSGVFFVLALASAGQRAGRLAAAFGGLITVSVLLNASTVISGLGAVFSPAKKATRARSAAGGGPHQPVES